ncbi:hypothetical protein OSB04_012225 [Centaurea solstitialis]|uniref:Integrase catalytic domain-containing protein n=1 Tax=Centaurea solstitialis TaxID=347529 RepID=A0AA38TP08_9ASTR|nr:hypothetical protein OSB04_012225 [Centaurea solstitialis]
MADNRPMWESRTRVNFIPRLAIKAKCISEELVKMVSQLRFDGNPITDPYLHLEEFEDMCDLFKTKTSVNAARLRLFPITLIEKAKEWFRGLAPNSLRTWGDLKSTLLLRLFPLGKINMLKKEIMNFKQGEENLTKAWVRYKALLLKLPNHGFGQKEVIEFFYNGLTVESRLVLDTSSRGIFAYRTVKEEYQLLEDMVLRHLDWMPEAEEEEMVGSLAEIVEELQFECEKCGHPHPTKFCTWPTSPPLPPPEFKESTEQILTRQLEIHSNQIDDLQKEVDYIMEFIKDSRPILGLEMNETEEACVTTRAGMVVEGPQMPKSNSMPVLQEVEPEIELPTTQSEQIVEKVAKPKEPTVKPAKPGMPNYVKFIKELVTSKTKFGGDGVTMLNQECSTIYAETPKKEDPRSFTIPCYFGDKLVCDALADLGASINLMPLSFYQKLGLGELQSTRMIIQLADRSIKCPIGIAEDVLVQVDKFVFPADFVVLDMKGETRVPLILGNEQDFFMMSTTQPEEDIRILEELLAADKEQSNEEEYEEIKQEETGKIKTSMEEPPKVELKDLLDHLEYQFLEGKDSLPVIISSLLKPKEKEQLLEIPINPEDQKKTNFTCPFGTFAYRRMPFGLCNVPATFQRCMTAIFQDIIEDFMEVFMDDFSEFGNSFDVCLNSLDMVLARCEESHLVLNWEKCHFMVVRGDYCTYFELVVIITKVFDVWGIDFMGPFPDSQGNKYILVAVDYVSKWAEAKALPTNDAKVVVNFVKSFVCRFGCPKAIISDRGTHFANYLLEKTLKRYGVHHRFSTSYHPQANGKAFWALKRVNLDSTTVGKYPMLKLHELKKLRLMAYENSRIYKEQRKRWHDAHLKEIKVFKEGDKVLVYQTRFKFSPGKLKSRWVGPYVVQKAYPSGFVDLVTERGEFRVNGQRLKLYYADDPIRNGELWHLKYDLPT